MAKEATASSIARAFNKKYRELLQKYSSFHASYGCEKKKVIRPKGAGKVSQSMSCNKGI